MAGTLAELLTRVIADGRITSAELEAIQAQVDQDGKVDEEEVRLMRELQMKLVEGTLVRVP